MAYYRKLVGEHVYLSPLSDEKTEIRKFVAYMNDFRVTDGAGNSHMLISEKNEIDWFDKYGKDETTVIFAIVNKNSDTLIGDTEFREIDMVNRRATVGIIIGEESQRGKGYGGEALKLLIGYGFDCLNLNNIQLSYYGYNKAAKRCYEKAGFSETGRRRQARYLKNKYYDEIFMDILREEYYGDKV